MLKWEGIINDPIGALLAVLVYEVVTVAHRDETLVVAGATLVAAIALAVVLGIGFGRLLA